MFVSPTPRAARLTTTGAAGRPACPARPLDEFADLPRMVTRAEVREDDLRVLESIAALHDVVQMHVPVLVDLVLAVARRDKRHLRNQHVGAIHVGIVVQPLRSAVAQVGHPRQTRLLRYFHARQTNVANLFAAQFAVLGLSASCAAPTRCTPGTAPCAQSHARSPPVRATTRFRRRLDRAPTRRASRPRSRRLTVRSRCCTRSTAYSGR